MKEWLKKNEFRFVVLAGIIIVAAISFEIGFLKGNGKNSEPMVIEKVPDNFQIACKTDTAAVAGASTSNTASNTNNSSDNTTADPANKTECAFVASKSSNKYHLPTCAIAQKIKPENKICFASAEEAQAKGYQSAKCCIK